MDAKTLSEEQLAELKRLMELTAEFEKKNGPKPRDVNFERVADWLAEYRKWQDTLSGWLLAHSDSEMARDAERYRVLKAGFGVMSVKMDSNHHWIWKHHPKLVGPTIDAAIDSAIKDTQS